MLVRDKLLGKKRPAFTMRPDSICKSITEIDFNYLKRLGVTTCLIDLDGTVVGRGTFEVDRRIGDVLSNSGLNIHIATNRPRSRSLKNLKEDLYAVSVIHPRGIFGKPSKRYYLNALKELHLQPEQVVMIGDRFIQDMLGANRAGIYSLLVHKLGKSVGRGDLYISKLEKIYTNRLTGQYHQLK